MKSRYHILDVEFKKRNGLNFAGVLHFCKKCGYVSVILFSYEISLILYAKKIGTIQADNLSDSTPIPALQFLREFNLWCIVNDISKKFMIKIELIEESNHDQFKTENTVVLTFFAKKNEQQDEAIAFEEMIKVADKHNVNIVTQSTHCDFDKVLEKYEFEKLEGEDGAIFVRHAKQK